MLSESLADTLPIAKININAIRNIKYFFALFKEDDMEYITLLMKMIGVTYLSEFSSSICRDAGYSAVAGQIELVGKLTILTIGMPIVLALFELMVAMI